MSSRKSVARSLSALSVAGIALLLTTAACPGESAHPASGPRPPPTPPAPPRNFVLPDEIADVCVPASPPSAACIEAVVTFVAANGIPTTQFGGSKSRAGCYSRDEAVGRLTDTCRSVRETADAAGFVVGSDRCNANALSIEITAKTPAGRVYVAQARAVPSLGIGNPCRIVQFDYYAYQLTEDGGRPAVTANDVADRLGAAMSRTLNR